ncbi:hypothetical protein SteCoe_35542 [Stentor coeruleus]|uniref:Uncharacterized protein n=1 Tax=Stentor coeruleus TaxID=5963 RepID=A0A1R2AS24_9CILI|nr:hypothetical protein SteCoe_35542 [Stentor coeruleus]
MEEYDSLIFSKDCENFTKVASINAGTFKLNMNKDIGNSSIQTQISSKLDFKLNNNANFIKAQLEKRLDFKLANNSTFIKSQLGKKLDVKLENNNTAFRNILGKKLDLKLDNNVAAIRNTIGKKLDIKLEQNTAFLKNTVGKKLDFKLEHNTNAIRNIIGRKLDIKLGMFQPTNTMRKAYTERQKELSISPLSGVPPPNDLRRRKFVPEIEYAFEKEAKEIKIKTAALEKEIEKKLNDYKQSNNEHLEKKSKVFNQIDECHNELEDMRESLNDILKDAQYTKEELKGMREKLDEEIYRDNEISTYKVTPDPVLSQLMDLKKEIDLMNNRLSFTENELKSKSLENNQLKEVVYKLKESLIDEQILESKSVDVSCRACIIV